ncbi:MAG: 4-hydroxy-3-methylbut-2-enyl diphosphate reductase [Deltaproteobacteria bacterium RBG_16_66_15]|nr:MAG: 4-hydroxy-3-methylbut-2-enyl diphosphate reductase [Deltaproteobacteria bacterium RBG_16_66_15]HAM32649.1 4-hydroxy-3-methylbut-2-enyl diphosphate reductase [Deltaproteobacteria bacterium]
MTKKVLIAKSAGFCFGVKRAIAIADETAGKRGEGSGDEAPIQSLGPIIHNPQAVERLQEKGVRVVGTVDDITCGKAIIRSHGVTRSDRAALEAKGVTIVDATCPFVTKAQEHARTLSRNGYAVVVVGDPNHPEVKSIISYIEKGVPVFTSIPEVAAAKGVRKAGVVAQTTQSFDNLMAFVTAAMKRFPEVRVFNTICNATALRQQESTGLAERADVMFVLGGYNSANTRRLAEICKAINPRTHHIETGEELTPEMVAGASVAGVTAGASTPQWIIDGFLERLKGLWKGESIQVSFYR